MDLWAEILISFLVVTAYSWPEFTTLIALFSESSQVFSFCFQPSFGELYQLPVSPQRYLISHFWFSSHLALSTHLSSFQHFLPLLKHYQHLPLRFLVSELCLRFSNLNQWKGCSFTMTIYQFNFRSNQDSNLQFHLCYYYCLIQNSNFLNHFLDNFDSTLLHLFSNEVSWFFS